MMLFLSISFSSAGVEPGQLALYPGVRGSCTCWSTPHFSTMPLSQQELRDSGSLGVFLKASLDVRYWSYVKKIVGMSDYIGNFSIDLGDTGSYPTDLTTAWILIRFLSLTRPSRVASDCQLDVHKASLSNAWIEDNSLYRRIIEICVLSNTLLNDYIVIAHASL
ncbi:hypothetical protein PMIN05_003284 [Paraphaeosphaeria minitans]